jgi:hypothetical protein
LAVVVVQIGKERKKERKKKRGLFDEVGFV